MRATRQDQKISPRQLLNIISSEESYTLFFQKLTIQFNISSKILLNQIKDWIAKSYQLNPIEMENIDSTQRYYTFCTLFYEKNILKFKNQSISVSQLTQYLYEAYIQFHFQNLAIILDIPQESENSFSRFPNEWTKYFRWMDENLLTQAGIHRSLLFDARERDYFGTILEGMLQRSTREEHGIFYSPMTLVNDIIQSIPNNSMNNQMVDPTCGAGIFLIGWVEQLLAKKTNVIDYEPIIKQIHGIDRNPLALMATLLNFALLFKDLNINSSFLQIVKQNLYLADLFQFHQLKEGNPSHPLFQKFNFVIGNLPWNVVNNITNPQEKEKIEKIAKDLNLAMTWKNRGNVEICTLLYQICVENLAQEEAFVGFLIPAAILTGSQHAHFRKFQFLNNLKAREYFPDLFPIHSIFLEGIVQKQKKFVKETEVNTGKEIKHIELQIEEQKWNITKTQQLHPSFIKKTKHGILVGKYIPTKSRIGNQSNLPIQNSRYHQEVFRGVDFTPRELIQIRILNSFLESETNRKLSLILPYSGTNSTQSQTWNNIGNQLQKQNPQGIQIESDSIRQIAKSTNLIPFMLIQTESIFFPCTIEDQRIRYLGPNEMLKHTKQHYLNIQQIYQDFRVESSKNKTLLENFNYGKKLENPAFNSELKVIYPVGGSYSKAAIIRTSEIFIDVTCYYLTPSSENEAYYLLGWLNSNLLHQNLPKVCSVGANGSIRVIHKAPWMFSLPKFENKPEHLQIVSITRELEKRATEIYNSDVYIHSFIVSNNKTKRISLTKVYNALRTDLIFQEFQKKLSNAFRMLFNKAE